MEVVEIPEDIRRFLKFHNAWLGENVEKAARDFWLECESIGPYWRGPCRTAE